MLSLCIYLSPLYNILLTGILCVNSVIRYMFYTDWEPKTPKLERAELDGSNRNNLVRSHIVSPHAVTLDYGSQHVYWVDQHLSRLERIRYDGTHRTLVLSGEVRPSIRKHFWLLFLKCILRIFFYCLSVCTIEDIDLYFKLILLSWKCCKL